MSFIALRDLNDNFSLCTLIGKRAINMNRVKTEILSNTLQRFSLNVRKALIAGKYLLQKDKEPILVTVSPVIDMDSNAFDGLTKINSITLHHSLYSDTFPVYFNTPTIESITIPSEILVTQHCFPQINTMFTSEINVLTVNWFLSDSPEVIIHTGRTFTPTPDLVGKSLIVQAHLSNTDAPTGSLSFTSDPIVDFSPIWPLDRLSTFNSETIQTNKVDDFICRLVCFNLLAPVYIRTKDVQDYYPQVTNFDMHPRRRNTLILSELLSIDGDCVCLQEVSQSAYERFLAPTYSELGYHCTIGYKETNAGDGCAIMLRKTKFVSLDRFDTVSFKELCMNHVEFAPIREKMALKLPQCLEEVIPQLPTVFAIASGQLSNGKKYIVANTHLFFHPDAPHIRMLQCYALHIALIDRRKEISEDENVPLNDIVIIVMGDFNASPDSGATELMKKNNIPSNHNSWWKSLSFKWESDDDNDGDGDDNDNEAIVDSQSESPTSLRKINVLLRKRDLQARVKSYLDDVNPSRVPNMELIESEGLGFNLERKILTFVDVYETNGDYIPFTTYAPFFADRLDWIYVEMDKWTVKQTLRMPTKDEIETQGNALPSKFYPSDHVALSADICFVSSE